MERQAFDRALEFLRFSRVAAWFALAASALTGVLFVALLVLLGLFVDLSINRGEIPCLAQLPEGERVAFLRGESFPTDAEVRKKLAKEHLQLLQDLDLTTPRLIRLINDENPDQLTPADRDLRRSLIWMIELPTFFSDHIAPEAGREVREALRENLKTFGPEIAFHRNLENRGILGLVVRTRGSLQRLFVHPMASWNDWTWRHGNLFYLQGLLLIAIAFALARGFLFFAGNVLAARAVLEAVSRLRRALYLQTYRLGTLAFRALGPSEAVGVSTRHLESLHDSLFLWLTAHYREPIKFGLLLAFALLVNFWLALAFLLFAGLVWVVGGQLAAHYRKQVREAEHHTAEQMALIQESFMLMRLVKVNLMEQFNLSRFDKQTATYAKAQEIRYWSEAIYRPLFRVLALLAGLTLLYLAGRLLMAGYLGVTSSLIMTASLVCLYWPVVAILDSRRIVRRGRDSAQVLFEFLDRPGTVGQAMEAEFLPALAKSLEFDNVALKEPGTGRKLLRGVSLSIKAGQRVALVGPDDMEKYALVYLLSRFLDPSQGEIRIDKKNIRWVTIDSLRTQVSAVLQHNLVFNDTIYNNIACGDPHFNLARIVEAAKVVHAHQFIQKLPKGYETPIGDMGHALKPGEMFRIALARALLRDPALIVIEEPHLPLDDDTKALVEDAYQRILPGRTVLFLPHRLSTLKSCDRIFFLHEGKIAAQGEHRELLQANDLYRHLQYLEFNEFAGLVTTSTASLPDVKI